MKIQIMSDIHCEAHRDGGTSFFKQARTDADVLVLAGDICAGEHIRSTMNNVCSHYPNVIAVLGNHEHWCCDINKINDSVDMAEDQRPNLSYLRNRVVKIGEQRFIGCTLWFRDHPMNFSYQRFMNDWELIPNLKDWVYEENKASIEYLENNVQKGDVVITHHLPSAQSTPERFKTSEINRFFVCDMVSLIERVQPKLWIHGHTHSSMNYFIGDTQVICNPFGYVGFELNEEFNPSLVVEV